MKKNNILIPIILCSLNLLVCLSMLIFCTPNQVPLMTGIHDEIILIASKWWLLLGIVIPIIFMVIAITKKSKNVYLLFTELIIFIIYNNLLAYSFYCTSPSFEIGMISEVPLSIAIFLPVSLACFVYGAIIKNIPYNSKFGLKSKRTTTTEFIWIQSHFYGSYYFRLAGLILFIVSIVFAFVRFPLIELIIFIIGLIIPRIAVEINAKQMTDKYKDMKSKHDHLTSKKAKP